jgi:peptide/nickel transport system substrate-binding protein
MLMSYRSPGHKKRPNRTRPPRWHSLSRIGAVGLVSVLFAAGCTASEEALEAVDEDSEPSTEEAADETDGGTLVVAQTADIDTLDPAMHRDRITQAVVRNIFEGLVNQDADLDPIPELAEEWEAIDDTSWRFHLREGVEFHNGEPFNAEAVQFSIERVLDEDQGSPRASMLEMISEVEIEDDYTVIIRTNEPAPTLLPSLAVNEIVPPGYVEEVGDEEFAAAPVGTGPFTFVSHTPNEEVVLEANADYWDGAPEIDTLIFRPIPETASRIAELGSGAVHIAAEIPPDLADTLGDGVEARPVDGTRVFYLAMNVTEAPFDDVDVRRAVNHAVDRDELADDLLDGFARPLHQPLFPEAIGYHDGYEGYDHDPELAEELFGDATAVQIDVEQRDQFLAEAVAGQLSAAGLQVTVNTMEAGAFTSAIESGDSQAYLQSWGVAEGDSDVIFARHFYSPSRADAFYTGYENPDVDALIEAGRSTVDEEERDAIYAEAVEIVGDDAPWAPLINPQEIYGVAESIENFEPSRVGRFEVAKTSFSS